MEIRQAASDDAQAMLAIYNHEVATSMVTFDIEERTLAEQLAWIARHQGVHPAIVAENKGVVAGFASLSVFRDRAAYSTTVEDSVYVAESHRGLGIGRLLLEHVLDLGEVHGFHAVIARIAGGNIASIRLHEACGFERVGTEREVGRKFGKWMDVTVLERLL